MSLQRVERALQQYGLEGMECVGQPFDPEHMEAVEVVQENGRAACEVIDEVRRGYIWKGRVFRFAQVRVAKP
jgi:molecular chaperone GrpE